ncbi:MAG: hypothetical protein M3M96_04435, partial [Candidatus Eremiobacteraeota bacterium]|nr:hypothetical protein [Candidatus Eremiobacteraeota bacterium]
LNLEVERHSLPTNGLPSGPGLVWWLLNARSHPSPQRLVEVTPVTLRQAQGDKSNAQGADTTVTPGQTSVTPGQTSVILSLSKDDAGRSIPLIGHSHLDVAWLWTYEDTRRKALRTFAIAADLLNTEPGFVFAQSQPQLYAFVEEGDAELFERIGGFVKQGRFDPDFAALWVEPDCNLPSGESLLRQMLYAHRYCVERFGKEPGIAWLPDSFGFANTLPMLLAHAGIRYFGTTKLQWNDTTRFPYPQFIWRAPDGSEVTAALINSMEGGLGEARVAAARERGEPLVTGYGDGGGGVTREIIDRARDLGPWIRPRSWFEELDARRASLPVHDDELYLEYHRGVYTTMHAVKEQNALLERALAQAEELVAWCTAVRSPHALLGDLRARLRAAWEIVLCNQFHDVLPGTSIQAVHDDALSLYGRAGELVASVLTAGSQSLPRAPRHAGGAEISAAVRDGDDYLLNNGLVRARVASDARIIALTLADGPNVCREANVLAIYEDRPKEWDAWNIDAGYEGSRRVCPARDARIEEDGALHFSVPIGNSSARIRMALYTGEPFVRVELTVAWEERHRLLRVETALPFAVPQVRYGTPHGSITRGTGTDTPAERAKFEVPGQRYALAVGPSEGGLALLALNTYGWSARVSGAGTQLGHSLLRSTTWPAPDADGGDQVLSYAFAPVASGRIGGVERLWERFACEPRVRLFTCADESVLIAACKPAEDGDGVILRIRECDGEQRTVSVRCGGRMREAVCVDALERPADGAVSIRDESLECTIGAFAIRSFRVRF